jgi:2-iminobutanoate/2-iminopropanoate deaminase
MMPTYINPEQLAQPAGPYTHVVKAGQYVYISGQAPLDPITGQLISASFEEEAHLVFNNIMKALASVGATLKQVVKVQAHLGDLQFSKRYNELYREYFSLPYPARTTVGSDLGGIKIEIDVIAYSGDE